MSDTITVVNGTNASGVISWIVGGPSGTPVFASGTIVGPGSGSPVAVSGYLDYQVVFGPVGYPENYIVLDGVVPEPEGTRVTLALTVN